MSARTRQLLFLGAIVLALLASFFGGRVYGQADCVEVAADCSQEIQTVMENLPGCSLTCPTPPPCPDPCPPPCRVEVDPASPARGSHGPFPVDYRFTLDFGAGVEGEMALVGATWNRSGRLKPFLAVVWIDTERELGIRAGDSVIHSYKPFNHTLLATGETSSGEHDQRAVVGVRVGVGKGRR